MYTLSYSVPVNPPGESIRLSREQVWRGLVMKAEDAVPFVQGMERCEVLKRWDGGLLRLAKFKDEELYEKITFTEPVQVLFERVGSDSWITNVISNSESGLLLTFTFAVSVSGVAAGSAEEKQQGEEMKASYIDAVARTLQAIRKLVEGGRL